MVRRVVFLARLDIFSDSDYFSSLIFPIHSVSLSAKYRRPALTDTTNSSLYRFSPSRHSASNISTRFENALQLASYFSLYSEVGTDISSEHISGNILSFFSVSPFVILPLTALCYLLLPLKMIWGIFSLMQVFSCLIGGKLSLLVFAVDITLSKKSL